MNIGQINALKKNYMEAAQKVTEAVSKWRCLPYPVTPQEITEYEAAVSAIATAKRMADKAFEILREAESEYFKW